MTGLGGIHRRDSDTWSVADRRAHARAVRSMFARISGVYDFMNHFLSLNRDRKWRANVVARLDPATGEILDLCAGTGDLALACRAGGRGRAWIAADFCPEMLVKIPGKPGGAALLCTAADALSLPLADRCVDAVTVGFGVRNFAAVRQGIAEIARVLRPGGQLLVLDFFRAEAAAEGEARGPAGLVRFGLHRLIPGLGRLFGRDHAAYSYLPGSMDEFLGPREFAALLTEAGFAEVFVERQTLGIAHIVGGRLPR
jgi:demethylmenaquinone methyltransferase/2-methoxy-6-polyprenyl-1,4-benzoquinol methylase